MHWALRVPLFKWVIDIGNWAGAEETYVRLFPVGNKGQVVIIQPESPVWL